MSATTTAPPPHPPPSANAPGAGGGGNGGADGEEARAIIANLRNWWKAFGKKKAPSSATTAPVFGVPLGESLRVAQVVITTAAPRSSEHYVCGFIPVVVAKCGLYLKENATDVEGVFRVSGSTKRMKDLQALFETGPKFGKHLDWRKTNFTPHDVASVFRRYLTKMPEPVIPLELYPEFRDVLTTKPFDHAAAIATYKRLIAKLPRANQCLLLYVLDLLAVFDRQSEQNKMNASNLAVMFQPGIISHPQHDMAPEELKLSQEVLEFLIRNQDHFLPALIPALMSTPSHSDLSPASRRPAKGNEPFMVPSDSDEDPPPGGYELRTNPRPGAASPSSKSLCGASSLLRSKTTHSRGGRRSDEALPSGGGSPAERDEVGARATGSPRLGGANVTRRSTAPSRRRRVDPRAEGSPGSSFRARGGDSLGGTSATTDTGTGASSATSSGGRPHTANPVPTAS